MKQSAVHAAVIGLLSLSLLSACGGGADADTHPAGNFVGQMAASVAAGEGHRRALATGTIDVNALFDWAEYKYPQLFPRGNGRVTFPFAYLGVTYQIRDYGNGNYLGLTPTNEVYGLGDFTNYKLQSFGFMSDFAAQVLADACNVHPGSCGAAPSAPLNECTDPAAESLTTGYTSHLVYVYTGSLTGEQTIDSIINGPGYTFEGQSAIKSTTTTTGSNTVATEDAAISVTTTTKVEAFMQLGGTLGATQTLGSLMEVTTGGISYGGITLPGTVATSKLVYSPKRQNLDFHLSLGQTGTITSSSTMTVLTPKPLAPVTTAMSETFTFEGKEVITVLGKSYNTCRYRYNEANSTTNYSKSWFIVGKGVPARTQSFVNSAVNSTVELKSGTYNGAPL